MIWGIVTAHSPMEGQEVDWKRLVQFALLGSSGWEQYAILLVRVSLGLFFAISGANKLFVAGSTQTMYETLVEAKVPFPHLMTYFVSGVEFLGGSFLTVGFLSSLGLRGFIGRYACRHPDHHGFPPCLRDFRLLTGSTISSTFRKSCTCSSLSG